MQNFGQYGQYGQYDQTGQFIPANMPPQAPDYPQYGQDTGYGHQWAQYEDQVAAYSASLQQQAENAAEGSEQSAEGAEGAEENAGQPGSEDEYTGEGYGGYDNGYAMPMYGYDASYMPEFGADASVQQYGYAYDPSMVMQQPYIDGNQPVVEQRWRAHPVLVFSLMLICFPIGLALMLFFTDWGAFAKTYTTIFVLAMALAVYEILVMKQVIMAPSIIQTVRDMIA